MVDHIFENSYLDEFRAINPNLSPSKSADDRDDEKVPTLTIPYEKPVARTSRIIRIAERQRAKIQPKKQQQVKVDTVTAAPVETVPAPSCGCTAGQRQVVFMEHDDHHDKNNVSIIRKSIQLDSDYVKVNLITSESTVDILLPPILSDTSKDIDSENTTCTIPQLKLINASQTVSHIVRCQEKDSFVSGKSIRLHPGESKTFYGVNSIWY